MNVDFSIIASPDEVYHTKLISVDPGTTVLTDGTTTSNTSSSSSSSAIYYYGNMVVPNENQKLRISMTTQNTIIVNEVKNVLIIPTVTIDKENGKSSVSILNNNNKEERKEIKVGISDSMNTEVISGLNENEKVISSKGIEGEIVSPMQRGPRM
jgi:macrolide-specific efflux system membrane fusion protein